MATYTADDFARADFARHPDGGLAMRVRPLDVRPWEAEHCYASDATMALTDWVPVPHGHYTRHNTPTAEHMAALWKEVAREHAARSSSARQHARDYRDSMNAAVRRANKAEIDAATYRADRDAAEEERDEALDALRDLGAAHRALQGLAAEIGRAEQPRALTAREHLQLAWDAAHVPVDGIIPAGAAYLMRSNRTGRVVTPTGDWAAPVDLPASETWGERRLLDPPTPSRPDGAEEIEAVLRDEWTFSDEDGGEDAFADLAERLASRGVRVATEEEARHATDE